MKTSRKRECPRCLAWFETPHNGPQPAKWCSVNCYLSSKPAKVVKPRAQMPRTTGAKKRKPISVASKEQAAKRNAGVSIVSGASEGLDAAHLCPRGLGGCDDADCTVSLTRAEHRAFDAGQLDLLRYLVPHHADEIAHALLHYRGDLPALLERLTGQKWVPVEREGREAA